MIAKRTSLNLLGALEKGNIGTLAAQRAFYELLINSEKFDLSISVSDEKTFRKFHPESCNMRVYGDLKPILIRPSERHLDLILENLFTIPLFTFYMIFVSIGINLPFNRSLIQRLKSCDTLLNLNLELFKGTPISLSGSLVKNESRILLIHKIYWSYRIFTMLWSILLYKGTFKKKMVIGPASFGPFSGLPLITQKAVKYVLNRFVDTILVREPCSAMALKRLNVKNCITVTDAALTKVRSTPPECSSASEFTIGFAPALLTKTLSVEEIHRYSIAHAQCIDDLIKNYSARIIFLPSSTPDIDMCKLIMKKMNTEENIDLVVTEDVDEYEEWVRRLNLLVTTRMHPSIIAARNYIPFAVIIYDHKQIGVLQQLNLQRFSMHIGTISYDNLKKLIDQAIENKALIKGTLESNLPSLQRESIEKILQNLN